MHTPDGFITSPLCILMLALYCGVLYLAYRHRSEWLNGATLSRTAFLLGLLFLLQAIDFPVSGGDPDRFLSAAFGSALGFGLFAAFKLGAPRPQASV